MMTELISKMPTEIEKLSDSELFELLIRIHDKYSMTAIDAEGMKKELVRKAAEERDQQIIQGIDASCYSREEVLAVLQNMDKK